MILRRGIATDVSGATAVEFALVASMLVMTIVFILAVGLTLYYGQALDAATYKAARQIMLGNVQNAGTSKDDFRTSLVCANLPSAFDCSNVIVNLQTVSRDTGSNGYYTFVNSNQTALNIPTANSATQYSPGNQQSFEYLQVVYPITFLPKVIASMLSNGATYNGAPAVMLVSTAAFRNERY